jgi:hypothetical protein
MGFGVSNLDNDAQEMDDLVKQLAATGESDCPRDVRSL